jgi:hypothetical protein
MNFGVLKSITSPVAVFLTANVVFAFLVVPIAAEEGGGGHVAPGGVATLIDAAPTSPGWVVEPIFVHYEGTFSESRQLPIGGVKSVGLDATVDTMTIGALHTFDEKLWGASYSAGIFVPYA